jgi:hypothetical protein
LAIPLLATTHQRLRDMARVRGVPVRRVVAEALEAAITKFDAEQSGGGLITGVAAHSGEPSAPD